MGFFIGQTVREEGLYTYLKTIKYDIHTVYIRHIYGIYNKNAVYLHLLKVKKDGNTKRNYITYRNTWRH